MMIDPETSHRLAVLGLKIARRLPLIPSTLKKLWSPPSSFHLPVQIGSLTFPNPIGLAAGFDKNAELADIIPIFGFGFMEVGTITFTPQEGNPKPRIFRIPEAGALLNRLGFNNCGAIAAAKHLSKIKKRAIPIGINIGKSRGVTLEKAEEDYLMSFKTLYDYADYFTLNISSPNTPQLATLQEPERLLPILDSIQKNNLAGKIIFVKISPDLSEQALEKIAYIALERHIGIVATNTTTAKSQLALRWQSEMGGISGKPLKDRSTQVIRFLHQHSDGKIPIIGVGGIFTAGDAWEKLKAGACLVQLFTGWVTQGPGAIRKIVMRLSSFLEKEPGLLTGRRF